jgi:hypothetical protein
MGPAGGDNYCMVIIQGARVICMQNFNCTTNMLQLPLVITSHCYVRSQEQQFVGAAGHGPSIACMHACMIKQAWCIDRTSVLRLRAYVASGSSELDTHSAMHAGPARASHSWDYRWATGRHGPMGVGPTRHAVPIRHAGLADGPGTACWAVFRAGPVR